MLYLKNTEVATTYHVSLRTVLNWIESTKQGKLDLVLHTVGNKTYVANTASNLARIRELVAEGKKYRNTRGLKVVSPKPEFYKLFTPPQVYDIMRNIELHHEIPRQYGYFDGGAVNWDKFANRLSSETTPNTVNSTKKLLDANQKYIDQLFEKYTKVNVIDLGPGNCVPIKELLEKLLEQGRLGRYVAIDISPEMLRIAERNIKMWFGDRVAMESYVLDLNYERFTDLLASTYLEDGGHEAGNLILWLGGTASNLRSPDVMFRTIQESMGAHDFLAYTKKLDSESTRKYFDFSVDPGVAELAPTHSLVVELLNLDKSLYSVELGFDGETGQRFERIRLKVSISIDFKFEAGERRIELHKDDAILVWRSWQQSARDVLTQFDRNDFYVLQSSQTDDQEYLLVVARVKCE